MKLIRHVVTDSISVQIPPAWWKSIIMGPVWATMNTKYVEETKFIDWPIFDFETPVALGMHIDNVVTDEYIYIGVTPIRHVDSNPNVAVCEFSFYAKTGEIIL